MKGYEYIVLGMVFTLITGAVWFITKSPMNATYVAIGQIIWGIIQMLILDKK